MAAHFFSPSDIIDVQHVPLLIYGGSGVGKTTLAQSADRPITLDFDTGIHRTPYRKDAMRFDSWDDVIAEQQKGRFDKHGAVVLDTLGSMMDLMIKGIMSESASNAQRGGLSQQGWGVLGNRFGLWMRSLLAEGRQVIAICHEEEFKDVGTGTRRLRPDLPGKMAYAIVHRSFDLIGYLGFRQENARVLDFSPTETYVGKNSAGFEPFTLGHPTEQPRLLCSILEDAKRRIGKTAEQSAAIARVLDEWAAFLQTASVEQLNERLVGDFAKLEPIPKRQVWALVQASAEDGGLVFDKQAKRFVEKEPKPAEVPAMVPTDASGTDAADGALNTAASASEGEHSPDPTPESKPAPSAASADAGTPAPASEKPKRGRKAAEKEGAA